MKQELVLWRDKIEKSLARLTLKKKEDSNKIKLQEEKLQMIQQKYKKLWNPMNSYISIN